MLTVPNYNTIYHAHVKTSDVMHVIVIWNLNFID